MFETLHFLLVPPDDSLVYAASYNSFWIIISVLLAILASFAALKASARISHSQDTFSRLTWVLISSFTLGVGVWAMHFVGMLALSLPCGVHYDPLITLVSMIPGILAGGVALGVVWQHGRKHLSPLLASFLLGTGIGTMHYTGMAAMHLDGFIRYNPALFTLSIAVAVALSYLALFVKDKREQHRGAHILPVAVIMGIAVSAMHYTAMSATYFMRGNPDAEVTLFTANTLAILVAVTTVILALAAMALAAISRNREITGQLRDSEQRLSFALEGAEDGVWDWNPQTDLAIYSRRWKEMIGYTEHEFPNTGTALIEHLHPADKERVVSAVQNYFAGITPLFVIEFRMRCKDGSWKWLLARGKVIRRDDAGKPLRMIGTHTDISERKRVEAALLESHQQMYSLLNSMAEGAYGVDVNGNCTFVNRSFLRILGFENADEIIGKHIHELIHHSHPDGSLYPATECRMYNAYRLNQDIHVADEVFWKKDGTAVPVEYWSQPILVEAIMQGAIATFVDITERRLAEAQIRNLAFYDALTQLPNRRLLNDRLDQAIAANKRNGRTAALMFLDLDNFKPLNDTCGHEVGDLLLVEAARRINACIRETDTAARFGGDEFVVMLGELDAEAAESAVQAGNVAEKMRAVLSEPYLLTVVHDGNLEGTVEHHCSASIGVVVFNHPATREEVLKWADTAMYKAKSGGRNRIVVEQRCAATARVAQADVPTLRLIWQDAYACGESTIDQEHRTLFELSNALLESAFTRAQHPEKFDANLEKLLAHVVQHFADEEAILACFHYSELEDHARAHKMLVERALQLRDAIAAGGVSIGELVDFLANEVVAQHMLKTDHRFYSLFNKQAPVQSADAMPGRDAQTRP